MAAGDIDAFKDIPGYKVIFKSVLKNLIQNLVQQLAEQTGEESVLLLASVTEGSLSHLGSESGKQFLQGHDDIKSQFLGFCLKQHHTQLQKQARAVLKPNEGPLGQDDQFSYQSPAFQLDTDFNPLVGKSQTLTKISNQSATLESKHRRGPYQTYRSHKESAYRHFANTKRQHGHGAKSLNNSNNIQHLSINSNEIIKIEKVGDDDTQSDSLTDDLYESESQMNAVSQTLPLKSSQFDAPREFTSQSETFPPSNQHVDEEYSLTSATDNSIQNAAAVHSELDPNVMVKLEPVTDSNELEIIGMESSQLAQGGEDWVPNVQTRMRYGATPADATDGSSTGNLQQYSEEDLLSPVLYSSYDTPIGEPRDSMWKGRQCLLCNKKFNTKQGRVLHERVHTGEKPYTCDYCGKAFAQKGNLKKHTESHTKQDLPEDSLHLSAPSSSSYTPVFRCTVCGKLCPSRWKLETHSRIHTGLKPFKCHICMKAFNVKGNLRMHIRRHETW